MKIAVLGSGSHALDVVEYLENIGAFVKWFAEDTQHQKAISKKVTRVHKRFLGQAEQPEQGRLCDLFRVVFEQNPEQEISQQMQGDNSVVFDKLTTLEMDYLKSRFESFEDFDLIIHLPQKQIFHKHSGPAGVAAIGELQTQGIDYTHGKWEFVEPIREVAIVGEKASHADNLNYLCQWLIEGAGSRRAFYITNETSPLSCDEYQESLKKLEEYEAIRAERFLTKLREWQKLEDYEKAKISRPADPIPLLVFFAGHNITAISKLSDQERLYLTCEIPKWRQVQKGEDNARQSLKTIAVDKLLVANGHQYKNKLFKNMKSAITEVTQLDDKEFEAGLLELDIDQDGCFQGKASATLIKDLEKVIHHYFMESE